MAKIERIIAASANKNMKNVYVVSTHFSSLKSLLSLLKKIHINAAGSIGAQDIPQDTPYNLIIFDLVTYGSSERDFWREEICQLQGYTTLIISDDPLLLDAVAQRNNTYVLFKPYYPEEFVQLVRKSLHEEPVRKNTLA